MALRKPRALSHEERIYAAADLHATAVSWAQDAIDNLELAADQHAEVAHELEEELTRLTHLRDTAYASYDLSVVTASRIRGLVGGVE